MCNNKILLLDDDAIFRSKTHEFLVFKKYDVKAVSNGQEGLNLLDDWIPDLILCNMFMPVMDGFNFHDMVKQIKYLAGIPFLFISNKKGSDLMRQCLLNGADDLLFKPIRRDELLAILESKLERFEKIKKAYSNIYIGENRNLLHEVNTPLTGIIGAVELLRTYGNDITVSEVADFHYDIKLAGERLSRTMKNLFLYQNFINNNLEFSSGSSTAVLESFTRIKKKIYSVHKGCEGRINFDIQESNLRISQTYLDFILYELIDNALKFSGDKPISIWGKVYCATYFYLAIKDRGIGFRQEELERINAGQQFNREKTEQQGLGLGLFLSKKILKKGKGVFTIISKKEKGTEISLFFPLQATEVVNNG